MITVKLLIIAAFGLVVAVLMLLAMLGGLIWAYVRLARAFTDLEKRHQECRHALARRDSRRAE